MNQSTKETTTNNSIWTPGCPVRVTLNTGVTVAGVVDQSDEHGVMLKDGRVEEHNNYSEPSDYSDPYISRSAVVIAELLRPEHVTPDDGETPCSEGEDVFWSKGHVIDWAALQASGEVARAGINQDLATTKVVVFTSIGVTYTGNLLAVGLAGVTIFPEHSDWEKFLPWSVIERIEQHR